MSTIARRMQQAHSGVLQDGEVSDVFNITNYRGGTSFVSTGVDILSHGGMVQITNAIEDGMWYYYDTERGATYEIANGNDDVLGTAIGAGYTSNSYTDPLNQNNQVSNSLTSWTNSGFTLGASTSINAQYGVGSTNKIYTAYSWRRAKHFFDVVKYTGNGASSRQIAHGLGSAPGMIWCKPTGTVEEFFVYHRGAAGGVNPHLYGQYLTKASWTLSGGWAQTAPTASNFSVGGSLPSGQTLNNNGEEYIAYIWGHDTGIGGDHVSKIECGFHSAGGGHTTATNGDTIDTPWRAQYIAWKNYGDDGYWCQTDKVVGLHTVSNTGAHNGASTDDRVKHFHARTGRKDQFGDVKFLEMSGANRLKLFNEYSGNRAQTTGSGGQTIMRLMVRDDEGTKPPEHKSANATQGHVFSTGANSASGFSTTNRVDCALHIDPTHQLNYSNFPNTGGYRALLFSSQFSSWNGAIINYNSQLNAQSLYEYPFSAYHWNTNHSEEYVGRPGYWPSNWMYDNFGGQTARKQFSLGMWTKKFGYHSFEHYRGNGASNRSIATSLGVKPEMVIVKQIKNHASGTNHFSHTLMFHKDIAYGQSYGTNDYLLNLGNNAPRLRVDNFWGTSEWANWTGPTNANQHGISYFKISNLTHDGPYNNDNGYSPNENGGGYIAWSWATVPGLSKIGVYTGDGQSTKNIDCGFTNGARMVMIKNCSRTSPWLWISVNSTTGGNDNFAETSYSESTGINPAAAAAGVFVGSTGTDSSSSGINKTKWYDTQTGNFNNADIMDQTSTGFQIKSSDDKINRTSDHYIFAAWA